MEKNYKQIFVCRNASLTIRSTCRYYLNVKLTDINELKHKYFIEGLNLFQKPVFRCVESQGQVQSSPYQCYAMPQDFVHLTTGEDPKKLIDFLKMVIMCHM